MTGKDSPKQAVVNKLRQRREEAKKRGVAAPLPILEMKDFLPTWSKKVRTFGRGSCNAVVSGLCARRSATLAAMG